MYIYLDMCVCYIYASHSKIYIYMLCVLFALVVYDISVKCAGWDVTMYGGKLNVTGSLLSDLVAINIPHTIALKSYFTNFFFFFLSYLYVRLSVGLKQYSSI